MVALRVLAWTLWALLGSLLVAPGQTLAAVWPVRAQWDAQAEARYSQWVASRFNAEFFYADSPYADIATDCADAAYGMRMAFAYEQGLPFLIRDPRQPGAFISEQTSRFDHVPAGLPRMRAFMDWVMNITSTASLVQDTYPVKIDREQIRPGIIYLTWHTHAMQVVAVRDTGVIRYMASTTPRAIRPMRATIGYPLYVPADPKARRYGDGFRRFRQPADYGRPEASLEGYGTEQFEQAVAMGRDLMPYYDWVRQRLAIAEEAPWLNVRRALIAVCELAWDRANAVEEAQNQLADIRQEGRACMTAQEFEEHSTPGRDRQLARAFEHLEKLTAESWTADAGAAFREFADQIAGRLPAERATAVEAALLDWCDVGSVDGGPGRRMSLTELRRLMREGRLSADPHAPAAARWGLEGYRPSCRSSRALTP